MELEPRRWWSGPLDVEQLAWSSVTDACAAVQDLAEARQLNVKVATEPALMAASFAAIDHLRVDGRAPQGWAPMSGFFPAADGWVRLHANYPHHAAALTRALGVTSRDELVAALATSSAVEVEDAVTAARGIAVALRTPEQWAAHPHGRATAGRPWVEVEARGDRPVLGAADAPLAGVRVLDLTRVIAGPTCSQAMACLGADVLRIDPPDRPELLDQYLSNGMGKRSAAADVGADPRSLEELVVSADVALVGYRPGALTRFGLDPESLLERNPRLVVAALSAWGEVGPWANRRGFDSIVQVASGIATLCGDGSKPGALPVQALDHATGHRLTAEVVRLLARAQAGIVRISLLGAARTLLALPAPPAYAAADLPVPTVEIDSPHGHLVTVPVPMMLDGTVIRGPMEAYAGADLAWRP